MKSGTVKSLGLATFVLCCSATFAQVTNRPLGGGPLDTAGPQRGVPPQATAPPTVGTMPMFLTLAPTAVNDISGTPVGTIQYVILSPEGAVSLGVISANGRLVPVPWQLVSSATDTTGSGRVALTVNADRQRLQQAPGVTVGQLSQLSQDPALSQIQAFFGLQSQVANQGATGIQTNTLSGAQTNTLIGGQTNALTGPAATNAISRPPDTGPGNIGTPPRAPNPQRPPGISPPPDTGPSGQGTPPPAPPPRIQP